MRLGTLKRWKLTGQACQSIIKAEVWWTSIMWVDAFKNNLKLIQELSFPCDFIQVWAHSGERWKQHSSVKDWQENKTKKIARIAVVFHIKSILYIVILSFYRNSPLSEKASRHSSRALPAPSQWIFSLVLNTILFEATQHPLKLVPRDSSFKEIVYTSMQQQSANRGLVAWLSPATAADLLEDGDPQWL